MKVFAKSDIGRARDMNQDAYYISDSLSEVKLYILADGKGLRWNNWGGVPSSSRRVLPVLLTP